MSDGDLYNNNKFPLSGERFSLSSKWLFLSQVAVLIFSFGISIITARFLGPYGRGVVAIVMLIPGFCEGLGNLGLNSSSIYFISGGRRPLKEIAATGVLSIIIMTAFFFASLIIFWGYLEKTILKGLNQHFLYYIGPLILFQFIDSILVSPWLVALQRFKSLSIARFSKYLALLVLIILLVVWMDFNVMGVIIALVIANLFYIFFGFYLIKDVFKLSYLKPILFMATLKKMLWFGIRAHLGNFLQLLNYRLDSFIINYYLNPSAVGIYSLGVSLAELPWQIPNATAPVLYPKVSASGDSEDNKAQFTCRVARTTLLVTAAASILVAAALPVMVPFLFGQAFSGSVDIALIILPGVIAASLSKITAAYLTGRGKPELPALHTVVTFSITIVLYLWLIPQLGIMGAAIASTSSYILSGLIMSFLFIRDAGGSWANLWLPTMKDLSQMKNAIFEKARPQREKVGH